MSSIDYETSITDVHRTKESVMYLMSLLWNIFDRMDPKLLQIERSELYKFILYFIMAGLATVARNGLRWTSMSLKRTLLQTEQCMDESSLSMAFSRLFRMEISSSSTAKSASRREESICNRNCVEKRQLGQVRQCAMDGLCTV